MKRAGVLRYAACFMMMGMTSRVRGRDEVEEGSAASNVLVYYNRGQGSGVGRGQPWVGKETVLPSDCHKCRGERVFSTFLYRWGN